eukprot:scaffold1157_cov106-Isochrysis_galbana.AAC.4
MPPQCKLAAHARLRPLPPMPPPPPKSGWRRPSPWRRAVSQDRTHPETRAPALCSASRGPHGIRSLAHSSGRRASRQRTRTRACSACASRPSTGCARRRRRRGGGRLPG